jgi:hypothetical protein
MVKSKSKAKDQRKIANEKFITGYRNEIRVPCGRVFIYGYQGKA